MIVVGDTRRRNRYNPDVRLGVLVFVAACYHAPSSDRACSIHCLDGACPDDLTCERTFCVAPGETCTTNFTQVTAGDGFACAIDTGSSVWCWGRNDHHQIDGTTDHVVATPRIVDSSQHWDAIDAGGGQLCGIAAGALSCWGQNDSGEIDDAVFGDIAGAHAIGAGVTAWSAVSAGPRFTCAIGDGSLYCWGDNTYGQLGDGSTTAHGTPRKIASAIADWITVSAGETRACAISATQGAFCWGDNTHGALGQMATGQMDPSPVPVTLDAPPTAIATTADATCAIAGGQLYCWGFDDLGELGDPAVAPRMTTDPHEHRTPALAAATQGWTELSAGHASFCGRHDSTLACWGQSTEGALGDGVWSESPAWRDGVEADAASVALGYGFELACTTATDGTLRCWGDNRYGQLGDGAPTLQVTPVSIGGGPWSHLTANTESACALAGTEPFCWGTTEHGEATGVVAGSAEKPCLAAADCDLATPRDVAFAAGSTQLTSGTSSHCALHGKTVTCWGWSDSGEIGTTDATQARHDVPVPDIGDWDGLLEYRSHNQCAHSTYDMVGPVMGTTYCWGAGTPTGPTPSRYPLFAGARSVEVDRQTTCFIDADGDRECTGDDTKFEWGNGGTEGCGNNLCDFNEGCGAACTACGDCSSDCDKTIDGVGTCAFGFAHVAGFDKFMELAGNENNNAFCAVATSGALDCWGDNSTGLATTPVGGNVALPQAISGLAGCTSVTMGRAHVCAACGGSVSCWGANDAAQLGLEPSSQILPPRTIDLPTSQTWVTVRALTDATCAISQDGDVACWGNSAHGALGTGGKAANLPRVVAAPP